MRSLDSAIGAQEFAAGMQTYYNYIRPHMGINGMSTGTDGEHPDQPDGEPVGNNDWVGDQRRVKKLTFFSSIRQSEFFEIKLFYFFSNVIKLPLINPGITSCCH